MQTEKKIFTEIIKRDGSHEKFSSHKISIAIAKAGQSTGEFDDEIARKLTLKVLNLSQMAIGSREPNVEEIQDIVEEVLLSSPYKKTAKAYILYREQHRRLRKITARASVSLVNQYLEKLDWQVNENSNMSFSLQGLNYYISSEVSKIYWLNEIYPHEVREGHTLGDFHVHDLGLLSVYTYYGKEVVIAKINGLIELTSFEKLYDLIENKERLLNGKEEVFAKYPSNVYVLDKKGWTKVKRVTRKRKNREMRFIKNRGGRSVIVTDNHPMITEKGDKNASAVTGEDKLFTVDLNELLQKEKIFYVNEINLLKEIKAKKDSWKDSKVYFNGVPIEDVSPDEEEGILHTTKFTIPKKIKLTEKFGYFVGFMLAEGYLSYNEGPRTVSLSQKDKKLLLRANQGLLDNKISGWLTERKGKYELQIKNPFLKFLFQEVFKIKTGSKNKTLPINSLLYNKKFVKGMISGLIDGDGSIGTSKTTISLRISSRVMLEQCYVILSLFGFTPEDRDIEGEGTVRFYRNRKIIQNYPLYGISFRKIRGGLPSEKYKKAKLSKKAWQDERRNSWHIVLNNKLVNIPDKVIYDITTESGTLIVNGMWNHNCVGWDLGDLLRVGFKGALGKIESSPAKHLRSALGQVVNFFYTLQGESAGAQAFSNFDTLLSPFIRYDHLSYLEVKQTLQEFLFNMNVATRVGFQSPFTNITLDLTVPSYYKDQPVIIGGRPQDKTYKEFQKEMDLFNKAFLEVMLEGDAKGRIFSFPIPTYNMTKDFDWDNPNLEYLWEATGKYGFAYFSNFVNSDMNPEDARSMCKLPTTQIIYKNSKGEIAKTEIRRIVDDFLLRGNPIKILVNGEFKPVKDVIKLHLENENIVRITLANGIVDKMTMDHPSLIIKNGKLEMIQSDKLEVGNEFPFAKYPYEGELGDWDLGRLIGLCIGDGWVSHNGATVNFVFSEKEIDLAQFIKRISEERFSAEAFISLNTKHHYIKISIASRSVAELVKEYVRGDNSLNKRLNSKLFARSIKFRKGVLVGLIESDGSVDKKRNRAVLHMGNKDLVFDILILSRSLGVNTTFYETENKTGENKKIGYSLRFSAGNPDWFVKQFGLRKGKNQKYNEYSNFYGVKIVRVEREKYTGYVYDFELDSKEHAFQLANGIITHNCCRLRIDNRELRKRGGGLFGSAPLTGSIGVVTINMPRIGYLSNTKEDFFKRLERLMILSKESLEIKRKVLEKLAGNSLYPYAKFYLRDIKKRFGYYWKNHFSTIGLVGMNEACLNFLKKNIGTEEGKNFTIEVLNFMRDKLIEFQEETGNNYNLEATPAESTSYRLAKIDKTKFPEIECANEKEYKEGAEPFYTNSTHLPVNFTDDVFELLDSQDETQALYTGGTVVHIFAGEQIKDYHAVKGLVQKVCRNYHLPYFTITPTFCYDSKTEVLTRNGWKFIKDVNIGEGIMTANPKTRVLSYEKVIRKFEYDYKGKMIHFKARRNGFDCLVTPNHRMFIEPKAIRIRGSDGKYKKPKEYKYFETAEKVNFDTRIPLSGFIWKGKPKKFFTLPPCSNGKKSKLGALIKEDIKNGLTDKEIVIKHNCSPSLVSMVRHNKRGLTEDFRKIKIPMDTWLKFFGIWLAEGYARIRPGEGGEVFIAQKDKKIRKEIEKVLKKLPFNYTKDKRGFYIYLLQLATYLSQFSGSKEKYIPTELKQLSKNQLEILVNWHFKGDGTKGSNYSASFSPRLRNDLQELYLKIGYHASVRKYLITKRTTKHAYIGCYKKEVNYNGKIYDIEVKRNHVIYVRRNGFPVFSSNSICPTHGYLSGEHLVCPKCGKSCEVYSRVVGYLRPVNQWNKGKQEEFKNRKVFKL